MGLRNRELYNDYNIYFITTTCFKWLNLLSVGDNMQLIENNLEFYCNKYKAFILGYVLMPNHIHLILYFNQGKDRVGFMRDFKKYTSAKIRNVIAEEKPGLLKELEFFKGKQKFKVWQDRFDELFLESRGLLEDKLEYIHFNPLQEHWSLVDEPIDFKFSSASFYESGKKRLDCLKHYREFI